MLSIISFFLGRLTIFLAKAANGESFGHLGHGDFYWPLWS